MSATAATSPRLVLVAAVARNGVIGHAGGLPWHLPADLKFFKATTMGRPLIMGRKTYDSIGRPLPGRDTIVVTRQADRARADLPPEVIVTGSIDAAVEAATIAAARRAVDEIMVVGGAEIYRATIGRADVLVLTEVDLAPEGDATFPAVDPAEWREVWREAHPATDQVPGVIFRRLERYSGGTRP